MKHSYQIVCVKTGTPVFNGRILHDDAEKALKAGDERRRELKASPLNYVVRPVEIK